MKRIILSSLAISLLALCGSASGSINIRGVEYPVDTVFHAKVGPGTTHTQLTLSHGTLPLRVYYLTIDKTAPGVSIRTVCATDKVAGCARTSAMAQSKSKDGLLYFAGTNGDFFATSGTATNGTSKVGSPTTSCTVDREIYKTSNSNYQFSVDLDGVARVCRLNYYTGTATIGESVTLFKGVNVASPNNGITLYTPRYWGSTNQVDYADNCYEVTAKIVDGDTFYAGGKFRLEVTSEPNASGDTAIPSDGYVIHGRGTSKTGCNTGAKDFVGALHTGDIVEFDNIILTPEGERIYPTAIVSGNPKNVGDGETLDTESERADASARHPRTSIGVSADGNTIIMMVIDGRTNGSVGVTTSMLADVMRYAGAAEALNLDGGGSSTMYTSAFGVRNVCSDGNERAVGNGVFAVVEAPEDNEIAEIQFNDWAKTVPALGIYTPKIYGYNKYGVVVSDDLTGFTLSCPEELGDIVNDGTSLFASGNGTYALTATYNGITASIPVTVAGEAFPSPKYDNVLIDNNRKWTVELQSLVDGEYMPVSANAFTWTSSDADVVSVTPEGEVAGLKDGSAVVSGSAGSTECSVNVKVECAAQPVAPVEENIDADSWTVNKTGISSYTLTPAENGFGVDYTISSTRGTKITLAKKIALWSLPDAIRVRINPGDASITSVVVSARADNEQRSVDTKFTEIKTNEENILDVPIRDIADVEDIGIYPIEFSSVAFTPSGKTNVNYHVDILGIEAVYDNPLGGVETVDISMASVNPVRLEGDVIVLPGIASAVKVYDAMGRLVNVAFNTSAVNAPSVPGIYIVNATIGSNAISGKIAR